MTITYFEQRDMTAVVNLAYEMYLESNYTIMKFNRVKVCSLFRSTIKDKSFICLIAKKGSNVVGILLGKLFPYFFTNDLMATDIIVYVSKKHRGGLLGMRFIKLFEQWAEGNKVKCLSLGVTAGVANDKAIRLYKGMGFKHIGDCFRKEFV